MIERDCKTWLHELALARESGRLEITLGQGITVCTTLEAVAERIANADRAGVVCDSDRVHIALIASVLKGALESMSKSLPKPNLRTVA